MRLSKENFKEEVKLVTGLDCGLTPGQSGRLTVGRKITLTLTLSRRNSLLRNLIGIFTLVDKSAFKSEFRRGKNYVSKNWRQNWVNSMNKENLFCGLRFFVMKIPVLSLPFWSSGQSFWLQIQRSWFDSRRYQILWEVVGLERGPLSIVSTTEELLRRKSSSYRQDNRDYGRRNPLRWPCDTLYPQTLALTSPKSCGRSVDIVPSWTRAMEFLF
jgi:hypothetical protein